MVKLSGVAVGHSHSHEVRNPSCSSHLLSSDSCCQLPCFYFQPAADSGHKQLPENHGGQLRMGRAQRQQKHQTRVRLWSTLMPSSFVLKMTPCCCVFGYGPFVVVNLHRAMCCCATGGSCVLCLPLLWSAHPVLCHTTLGFNLDMWLQTECMLHCNSTAYQAATLQKHTVG